MRKRCGQILTKLRRDKRSVWFNAPVEVERLGLHDYHTVIKSPMDLGTVTSRIFTECYIVQKYEISKTFCVHV